MAGYDFKVSDIIDPKAIEAIEDLGTAFEEAKRRHADLAMQLAKKINVNVDTIQEFNKLQEELAAIKKEVIKNSNKLADTQEKYKEVLKKVNEQTKQNTKAILNEAKAKKELATAELQSEKAKTERLRQDKLINQQSKKRIATEEEIIKALNTQVLSINQAKEQNKLLRSAVADVVGEDQKAIQQRNILNAKINENTMFVQRNTDAYTKQKMTIGDYKEQVKSAIIELKNGEKGFKNIGIVAQGFGGILKESVSSGINQVSVGVGNMIKGFVGAQAVLNGIRAFIGQIKSGIKSIVDFDTANSKLAATLGTTKKEIKDMMGDAQRLGASTKYAASEVTGLQIELAKLGFSRQEILDSTESILKFAQATGVDLPEAAALAGASLRMFDASTKETERYVSTLAVATTKSALSFSYLQTALPTVGPVAKAFGFTIEDTTALLGKLADAGFDASSAATATRNVILNLSDSSGKLAKALGKPVKTLPDLVAGLKELNGRGIDLNEILELTDKRTTAAFSAFLTAADDIVPLREQITGVEKELGDTAKTMNDNVQGAIANLSSAWESLALTFSNSSGKAMIVINWFADKLRDMSNSMKDAKERVEEVTSKTIVLAQKDVNDEIVKLEIDVQKRLKELRDQGLKEEEARAKVLEELEKKKIEVAAREKALEKEKEATRMVTNEFINQHEYVHMLGNMFGYASKKTKEADKATADYTRSLFELTRDKEINKGIEAIAESLIPKEEKKPEKPTEKELKELEKQAKERLKIMQALQDSELNLMDDGLEKELKKIRLNYTKRIAAITGQSNEEKETRKNLAIEMQNELDKQTFDFNITRETENLNNRLAFSKAGSDEEMKLRLDLLKISEDKELEAAIKTGADLSIITQKYEKERLDIQSDYAMSRIDKMQDEYALRVVIMNSEMQKELDDLLELYKEGKIDRDKYEKEKTEISEKYAKKSAQLSVELLEKQIEAEKEILSPEDLLELEKELSKAKINLSNEETRIFLANDERVRKSKEETLSKIADGIQKASQMLNSLASLGSTLYDNRIKELDEESEKNQAARDEEISKIEEMEKQGAISKEEAEAKKRIAEAKTADKEDQLAKKKAQLQTRQARFEKANNMIQVAMNTAAAITKQLAATPLPLGAPFVAYVSALGAIQLATVAAQKIPKYAKGTDNHPGGLAIVGDGGKQETVITPQGKSFLTPSIPILVDLPRGSQVIPEPIKMDPRDYKSDLYHMIERQPDIIVNVKTSTINLEKGIDESNRLMKTMIRQQVAGNTVNSRYGMNNGSIGI